MARSKFRKFVLDPVLGWGPLQWFFAFWVALIIYLVFFTCCTHVQNKQILKEYRKKPAVIVFWHGRTMMLSPIMKMYRMRTCAVASRHKDGRLMAKIQWFFGAKAIFGSSTEGGVQVLRLGVKVLRDKKRAIIMSPDGPSGPSLRVQSGAIYFAKMTGVPIIPISFSSSKSWFQSRWDRYLVTLPFSKIICKVGQPIFVDSKIKGRDFENVRKYVEDIMVKQVRDNDKAFNLMEVEQDMTGAEFKKRMREERMKLKKSK